MTANMHCKLALRPKWKVILRWRRRRRRRRIGGSAESSWRQCSITCVTLFRCQEPSKQQASTPRFNYFSVSWSKRCKPKIWSSGAWMYSDLTFQLLNFYEPSDVQPLLVLSGTICGIPKNSFFPQGGRQQASQGAPFGVLHPSTKPIDIDQSETMSLLTI